MKFKKTLLWTFIFLVLLKPVLVNAEIASPPASPAKVPITVKGVTGTLGLYNTITVEVENLSKYLEQHGKDVKKFLLYLDWRPLKKVNPRLTDGNNKLQFDIRGTSESKYEWNALLGKPFARNKGFTYLVPVSIGYENENPIPSDVEYPLIVISKTWFWIFLTFFTLALSFFVWMAKASSIIRDPCPELPPKQRPYSLGRTQMAFWFFVVAVSYVLIWMITSDLESLTESALGLIGISAATALSAAVVGSSKRNATKSKLQNLEKEKTVLQVKLNELGPQIAACPPSTNLNDLRREEVESNARLAQVNKEIRDLTAVITPRHSEGFVNDILTDADGISLHRFQIVIWTILLGFIFAASIYNNLAMPEFSGTLLALMGISGGTYIGFKFPEK